MFAPEDIEGSEDLGKTADIVLADEQASDRGRGSGDQEGVSARLTLDIVDLDYGDEDEFDEAAEQTEQQKLDPNDVEKAPNVSFWNQL